MSGVGRGRGLRGRGRMLRALLSVTVTALAAAGAVVHAGNGGGADDDVAVGAAGTAGAFVREVRPGHFVHVGRHADMSVGNGGDIANIGFVVGDAAVAVIDPGGGSVLARRLLRALRDETSLPVTHVVLTHFHPDHVLGAAVFTAEADVVVVAHERHARAVVQRGPFYVERYAALLDSPPTLGVPTLGVAAGASLEIDLGGVVLAVDAWPTAHTDNDVSVFDERSGTLWAGDLVLEGRTPSLDGSLTGWLDVLDRLAALDATLVVPGHGEPGAPGPMLDAERRYLEDLLEDTRARLAAGGRLADALADAETAPPGRWALFELHHPANVTRAWTELEWD